MALLRRMAAFLLTVSLAVPVASPDPGPGLVDADVLLPPAFSNPVQYRLVGIHGCFVWSWDHHDILFVQPEFNGNEYCSISALLISIAPWSRRKETAVYARDRQSGLKFKCKVVLDMISRIQIFHPVDMVVVGGLAKLSVHAFDSEGNEFSSLMGSRFYWQIGSDSTNDNYSHHLVHVPLRENSPSYCGGFCGDRGAEIQLEDEGLASDLFIVKGIRIGYEVVHARLLEPHLEHLATETVLTVAETTFLYSPPQDASLVPSKWPSQEDKWLALLSELNVEHANALVAGNQRDLVSNPNKKGRRAACNRRVGCFRRGPPAGTAATRWKIFCKYSRYILLPLLVCAFFSLFYIFPANRRQPRVD